MDERLIRLSKTLAYVLRHNPDAAGVQLDPSGWVDVDLLHEGLRSHGHQIERGDIDAVIAAPGKQRYERRGGLIRAMQGHSVSIALDLDAQVPPDVLLHGTVARFLDSIRREGLRPKNRSHVHLSADVATAADVGGRRGDPVVLTVDSAAMHAAGHDFFVAANGVWLTNAVPPQYLTFPNSQPTRS